MAQSNAFIGNIGRCEQVDEYKLEIMFAKGLKSHIVSVLLSAHPYEVPAYQIINFET